MVFVEENCTTTFYVSLPCLTLFLFPRALSLCPASLLLLLLLPLLLSPVTLLGVAFFGVWTLLGAALGTRPALEGKSQKEWLRDLGWPPCHCPFVQCCAEGDGRQGACLGGCRASSVGCVQPAWKSGLCSSPRNTCVTRCPCS